MTLNNGSQLILTANYKHAATELAKIGKIPNHYIHVNTNRTAAKSKTEARKKQRPREEHTETMRRKAIERCNELTGQPIQHWEWGSHSAGM